MNSEANHTDADNVESTYSRVVKFGVPALLILVVILLMIAAGRVAQFIGDRDQTATAVAMLDWTPTAATSPPAATETPTATFTLTPTLTVPAATATPTTTPTPTTTTALIPTPTATLPPTELPTPTVEEIAAVPTATATRTAAFTATLTRTPFPSPTAEAVAAAPTLTRTPSPTATTTKIPSATARATESASPSPTATPTQTTTPSATATATHTLPPTVTRISSPTVTSTQTTAPSATSTVTLTRSPTPTRTPTPTIAPTQTTTPTPTDTPSPSLTVTPTQTATATSIPTSTSTPTASSTATATLAPSLTATAEAAAVVPSKTLVTDEPGVIIPIITAPVDGEVIASNLLPVAGTAAPGARVAVVEGEVELGRGYAGEDGIWQFTVDLTTDAEPVRERQIVARVLDEGGSVLAVSEPATFIMGNVEPSPTPTVPPTPAPTVKPAITRPAGGETLTPGNVTFAGTAGPDDTVRLVNQDSIVLGTVIAARSGEWQIIIKLAQTGPLTVTAQVLDEAGAVQAISDPVSYVVAPAIVPDTGGEAVPPGETARLLALLLVMLGAVLLLVGGTLRRAAKDGLAAKLTFRPPRRKK
ncbi:MAG: hypothetical protein JXB47_11580 [Anaerolineae bacterium]|nr:hypothetical protein [Anaerolineae bacterium]